MPEVNIIGSIVGCSDFEEKALLCEWQIVTSGTHWDVVEGEAEGQTHVVEKDAEAFGVWSHPFDAHFSCSSIEGWPQLAVQVWQQDEHTRNEISGYGSCCIPIAPGTHRLEIPTWRPEGTFWERVAGALLGGQPQLKHPEVVSESTERVELRTVTRGTVHVEVQVLLRGFEGKGVEFAG